MADEQFVVIHYVTNKTGTNQFTGKPTGESKKFDAGIQKAFRKLAIDMCANYDNSDHTCLYHDKPCNMIKLEEGRVCEYFRKAVLPLDPVLELKVSGKQVLEATCAICGKKFETAGKQVYCSNLCQQKGIRLKEREKKK